MITKVIGKAPHKVWNYAYLVLEFGPKRTVQRGHSSSDLQIWVEWAHWRIRKGKRTLAEMDSDKTKHQKAFEKLQGRVLSEIEIVHHHRKKRTLHSAHFRFVDGYVLDAFQTESRRPASLFAILSPTEFMTFENDGSLTKERPRDPNNTSERISVRADAARKRSR